MADLFLYLNLALCKIQRDLHDGSCRHNSVSSKSEIRSRNRSKLAHDSASRDEQWEVKETSYLDESGRTPASAAPRALTIALGGVCRIGEVPPKRLHYLMKIQHFGVIEELPRDGMALEAQSSSID
jgi:hypothetical protein